MARIIGFYTDKQGRKRPITSGLFYPKPYYPKYAEIVKMDSVEDAHHSVKELMHEFENAKTHEKKMRVWHVLDLAAKRAEASSHRENLSPHEREKLKEISNIYRRAADHVHSKIGET